jgi:hypothetical protein
MGGNVWEWNETLVGSDRVFRGGSYGNIAGYGYVGSVGDLKYRYDYDPGHEGIYLGFRVAFVACPSADLTNDCFVDFEDMAKLVAQWLTGSQ